MELQGKVTFCKRTVVPGKLNIISKNFKMSETDFQFVMSQCALYNSPRVATEGPC